MFLKLGKAVASIWLAAFWLAAATTPGAAFDDLQGKEWRWLNETQGLSWAQVASICPQDGATPCAGSINGRDLTGWVWGTPAQVRALMAIFAPTIPQNPPFSVGGPEYVTPATQFQNGLGVTAHFQGCPTYQPCFNFFSSAGWTATPDGSGVPSGADASTDLWGLFGPTGGFTMNNPPAGEVTSRGAFLWHPTGLDDGNVYAYNDYSQSPSPFGGVATNVLYNDWVGGVRATANNVVLTLVSMPNAGITLNPDGSVTVAPGTPIGTSSFDYRICAVGNPDNCDEATVTITVKSFAISAANDQGSVSFGAGGTAVANVLANDRLGGVAPTAAVVALTQLSSSHAGISLNLATGAVNVAPGTPSGIHTLSYRICEIANPANCAQAAVTLTPHSIDAVNDSYRMSSKTGGTSASVLANDWFKGARATTAQVSITLLSTLIKGVTFNPATGTFTVAPKTSSGTYFINYRICEIASPDNCDSAIVALDLSGR